MPRIYTREELDILLDIHAAAMKTALPVVIAVFKYLSNYLTESVNKSDIFDSVIKDLSDAGYVIPNEEVVEEAIRNLIGWKFLKEDGNRIILRKKGKEAIEILRLGI